MNKEEFMAEFGDWDYSEEDVPLAKNYPYREEHKTTHNPPSLLGSSLAKGTSPRRALGTYTREENQRGAANSAAMKRERVVSKIESTLPDWIVGVDKFIASDYIRANFPKYHVAKFRRMYRDVFTAVLARVASPAASAWLAIREAIRKGMARVRGIGYVAGKALAYWARIGLRLDQHPSKSPWCHVSAWVPELHGWYGQ